MKRTAWLLALLPALAWAAAPFDGTWVSDMKTVKITGKPDTYLVQDGMFTCDACVPELKIKADGSDQRVTGHDYYDTASARVVDAHTVEMATHKDGKLVAKRTLTVSADGKTMTEEFVTYDGATQSSGKLVATRVAPAPPGAHALSGSWRAQNEGSTISADLLTVTYQQSANGLKMSSPTGQSYEAKFNGKEAPVAGDPGNTMVSLKRIDERTIQETDRRKGKITDIATYKVSADGKTMQVVDDDKLHGTKMSYKADRK